MTFPWRQAPTPDGMDAGHVHCTLPAPKASGLPWRLGALQMLHEIACRVQSLPLTASCPQTGKPHTRSSADWQPNAPVSWGLAHAALTGGVKGRGRVGVPLPILLSCVE